MVFDIWAPLRPQQGLEVFLIAHKNCHNSVIQILTMEVGIYIFEKITYIIHMLSATFLVEIVHTALSLLLFSMLTFNNIWNEMLLHKLFQQWLAIKTEIKHIPHDIYIRWYLINMCARKEQSLLFDLYKAFDKFESRHKSGILTRKDLFSIMRA